MRKNDLGIQEEIEEYKKEAREELLGELNKYLDNKYYRENEQGKSIISDLRSQLKKLSCK